MSTTIIESDVRVTAVHMEGLVRRSSSTRVLHFALCVASVNYAELTQLICTFENLI